MTDLPDPVTQTLTQLLNRVRGGQPEQLMLRDFIYTTVRRLGMVSSEEFGTVGNGIVDDSVALQDAADYSSETGIPIFIPWGTYLVDGYKGAKPNWTAGEFAHGGIIVRDRARLIGAGRNRTILKNYVDNWRCVLRLREGADQELANLTVDGDINNHPNIELGSTDATHGSVRGEGIIFEGTGTLARVHIHDCEVKNTGHYGVGIENVELDGGLLENLWFENIGGDCIDVKAYETLKKWLMIRKIYSFDGCGHNYIGGPGVSPHENQAVVDIRGHCIVDSVIIEGLDSYGTQIGNAGVRLSPPLASDSNRQGAKGSIATNLRITSSKLANEGSGSLKRIIGVAITDSDVEVSNYKVKGCYWGIRVFESGDGIPTGVNISNGSAEDCSSAAGNEAFGLGVSAACSQVSVSNHRSTNCEIGASLSGTLGSYSGLVLAENTTLGLSASDAFFASNSISTFHFSNNAADMDAAVLQTILRSSVIKRGTAVVKDRGGTVSILSTADDGNWSGANAVIGGFQVLTSDTGGAGVGFASQMLTEMRAASGATGALIRFKVQGAAAVVDALTMSEVAVVAARPLTLPAMAVASLPTTAPSGSTAFANDSNATLAAGLGNVVAGGGANFVPVYFDAGAQWRIG